MTRQVDDRARNNLHLKPQLAIDDGFISMAYMR